MKHFPTASESIEVSSSVIGPIREHSGGPIIHAFQEVIMASRLGSYAIAFQTDPYDLPAVTVALEDRGYVCFDIDEDTIEINWSPAVIRRMNFKLFENDSNE